MLAALISNGPSARMFPGRLLFDVVIAANWTVEWLDPDDVDWWAFSDWQTFAVKAQSRGEPGLYTKKRTASHVRKQAPAPKREQWDRADKAGRIIYSEDIKRPPTWGHNTATRVWSKWTGGLALGLAYHLGATEIVVYGADMQGRKDHQGREGPSRTPERWVRERRQWAALVSSLAEQGVNATRVVQWP